MLFNRDLSWLGFNYRVLQEAKDKSVPLYERLKFLAIFSSNLDEFFRVRYPAIIAFSKLGKKTIRKESLLSEEDVSQKIHDSINTYLEELGKTLLLDIIPALKDANIFFYYKQPLQAIHLAEVRQIFLSQVLSFIQPIFLDSNTSTRFLPENNQPYLVVTLRDKQKSMISHVILNIPSKKLQRFYVLASEDEMRYVVFIDDILRENLPLIFPGQVIESMYSIKFNRDAELKIGDDYSEGLLNKLEKLLSRRDTAATSRFLYESGMPANLRLFLASLFEIEFSDMFEGGRYHNLSDLFNFPSFEPALHYKKEKPILYPRSSDTGDLFRIMLQRDILLHLPYHSYTPVLSFFNQAAVDPEVTEIYITLYRVAAESHIVNALISASKNGKKVTVFVELKARFDEANNIKWSRVMKQAGVRLIYSDATIKVHSKIALVKKQSTGKTTSFAVLSTGNFNESTATFYTDHVLMTTNKRLTAELQLLFDFLQKKHADIDKAKITFKELLVSQFNMVSEFERLIDLEIKKSTKGLPALIRIKVNNLEEPYFINLLYMAARAGVTVELIVRSICCLVPGVPGESENITVKRIVDRYLEHSRIFIFGSGDSAFVAMGSADLMTRNLRRRIEVCIQVKDELCRTQLIDYFEMQWRDNSKAGVLLSDGSEVRVPPGPVPYHAASDIYEYLLKLA